MQIQKYKKTDLGEIPEEWSLNKLIELCAEKPCYGAAVSAIPKVENLPRYVRITDLNDDGYLNHDDWVSISLKDAKPYLLNEGQILFARTGATVGKTYLYRKNDGECAFAGYLIRFIPDKTKLDPEFLFYYTHSTFYWKWLRSIQTEGVQPNVNANQYSNMIIPVPPIREQRKIAFIISNIDNLIKKTGQIIEHTQSLKNGLMQWLLTKGIEHTKFKKTELGEIPEEWKIIKLKEASTRITDGVHFTPKYQEEGVPFISVNNLTNGKLDFKNCKFISQDSHGELIKRCNPQKGDILLSKVGTLGIADIIDVDFDFSIFVQLCLIKPNTELINPHYLKYLLNSKPLQRKIDSNASGTTLRYIGINKISDLNISLPQLEEQQKIASILSNIEYLIEKLKDKKKSEGALKKGLMQQLLTGKVRVKV